MRPAAASAPIAVEIAAAPNSSWAARTHLGRKPLSPPPDSRPERNPRECPWSAAESISLVYLDAKISAKCGDFAEFPRESRISLTACWRELNSNCRATSETVSKSCKSVKKVLRTPAARSLRKTRSASLRRLYRPRRLARLCICKMEL
jgi:hypothetical protein